MPNSGGNLPEKTEGIGSKVYLERRGVALARGRATFSFKTRVNEEVVREDFCLL